MQHLDTKTDVGTTLKDNRSH